MNAVQHSHRMQIGECGRENLLFPKLSVAFYTPSKPFFTRAPSVPTEASNLTQGGSFDDTTYWHSLMGEGMRISLQG